MKTVLIAGAALLVGVSLGVLHGEATYRHLRKRLKELQTGKAPPNIIRSITRFLFVTTQIFALVWVTWSYIIATYSTVVLLQPFPVESLSCQAIITILGMSGLKVVENIFEHNEGVVFGKRAGTEKPMVEASDEDAEETEGKG